MVIENDSALTFQQLRDKLGGVIKRVHADDTRGLPVDTLTAEAGSILATMHQFMDRHKDTRLFDTY